LLHVIHQGIITVVHWFIVYENALKSVAWFIVNKNALSNPAATRGESPNKYEGSFH
jgi:hypothetical protein